VSDVRSKTSRGLRAALAALSMCALAVSVASAACLTAVPDLPQYPPLPPSIENDAVQPPPGVLPSWPVDNEFTIPVEVSTPGETFVYEVVVDYGTPGQSEPVSNSAPMLAADGGVTVVPFTLLRPADACSHRIDFVVAHTFEAIHVPDSIGGDSVSWTYSPGAGTDGCPLYDAGSGVIPDASSDVLPLPGGDP
jgi:hypothetical protein